MDLTEIVLEEFARFPSYHFTQLFLNFISKYYAQHDYCKYNIKQQAKNRFSVHNI